MINEEIPLSKMRYGWSKYGGPNYGIAKQTGTTGDLMLGLDDNIWYCQLCGEEQNKELPNYLFSLDDTKRDFIRVCTKCKFDAVKKKVTSYRQLIKLSPDEEALDYKIPTKQKVEVMDTFKNIDERFEALNKKDFRGYEEKYNRKTIEEYLICIEFLEQLADEKITQNVSDLTSQLLSNLTLVD